MRPGVFEQTFKNIDDVLWKEADCTTELDYTEQTSWMLFLKYLDDLEKDNAQKAELAGKPYSYIIEGQYRWAKWAAPRKKDGTFDHDKALTGKDLIEFVDRKLFPYLEGFRERAEHPDTIEYKIGEIFGEIKNKFSSGYSLRDALELIDGLRFRSQAEKHELSHLYEAKIRNMGNAGRNGGEYYTPRPLIRAMIRVTDPKIGERIYDGAAGSCGFLCEAFDYLLPEAKTTRDRDTLQKRTFFAKEKKSLAYVIGIMNMILHGIEAPNIVHTNTLAENLADIQQKDRFDVILANPPFGGKERPEIQQNFPIKTGETAFLFLQHFIKMLKAGGRGAIVIKNSFLSSLDGASVAMRKELLESCNLHTVLDMPGGTFQGAGVKTVVLFFEKGTSTRKIWFYKLNAARNLGKTSPLDDGDLTEFVNLQRSFEEGENSWSIDIESIDQATFGLSASNPSRKQADFRSPSALMTALAKIDEESSRLVTGINELLERQRKSLFDLDRADWKTTTLETVCDLISGQHIDAGDYNSDGVGIGYLTGPSDFGLLHPIVSKWTLVPKRTALRNDILVTVKGSGVGKVNLMDAEELAISRQLMAVRAKGVSTGFLYAFLSMQFSHFQSLATGAAIPGISREDVLGLKIAVPSTAEQERVFEIIDEIQSRTQRLEAICEDKKALVAELNNSILKQALLGHGRVMGPVSEAAE